MQTIIYNQQGKASTKKVTLPEEIFGAKWNADLVHQVVSAMQANARTSVAHTKDRSEVRGGGRKPWKQKGTGRARHGSSRSPIWIGGGVAFGPRNDKDYSQKINKKMRVRALFSALSAKNKDNEILFLDTLVFDTPKASQAKKIIQSLSTIKGFEYVMSKKNNSALILTSKKDDDVYRSFGNFNNIAIEEIRNLNTIDALKYKYLIIVNPEESISILLSKIEKKKSGVEKSEKSKEVEKPKVVKKDKVVKTPKVTKTTKPATKPQVVKKAKKVAPKKS